MRVQLLGIPTDVNSSYRRGAAAAPRTIRAAWRRYGEFGNYTSECGRVIGDEPQLEDCGDVPIFETPEDHERIVGAVTKACGAGPVLCLGGDHSVTFPVVEALAGRYGPLNLLHFDAHPDLYEDYEGNPRSHASPFARIMEHGLARRLVQVGVRTWNAHNRRQAQRYGVEVVEWGEFAAATVPIPDGLLYVTIDFDAFDPAFAPGVSHPEPGGLTVREVIAVLSRIRAPVVGADIVELNPACDQADATAIVAVKLIKELAAAMARGGPADCQAPAGPIDRSA